MSFTVRAMHFVAIANVKDFGALQEIAKKHRGIYANLRFKGTPGPSFVFAEKSDAEAFTKESGTWPMYGESP